MERSGGINNMRLPTSPMSFPSSNINIPGSLVLDGSASIQHLSQQQQQQAGQGSVPMGENNYSHIDKKPRLDVKQEDMLQQQQLQLQQQQLLRQQQGTQQIIPPIARKMMMYLYHLQQRPAKFVAEYFSPRANQRLCLSQYANAGKTCAWHDKWQCDLCGTKSGEGFEATFDVLARLNEIKFASGIIDEFSNGLMLLEYRKAVQETVHEQFRVVREGHLRIIFSQDLKILSWEFCARRHEELLLRRLIAPQVNQLLQVAQKCQTTISESGSEGVSQQDLKSNSNMVLGAGRQLAKFMELQSLNDLGYPKRYIRTLQALFSCSFVKSMKDLMNFTGDHKLGPIEGLKRLLEQTATAKLQRQKMQEMGQLGNSGAIYGSSQAQMALTSGTMNDLTGNSNNNNQTVGRAAMNGSAQAAAALTNYQSMLMRQNAMNNPNSNTCKQDAFSSQNPTPNSNQSPSSSSHQMQQQQRTMNGAPNMLQHNHPHHLHSPHGNNQEHVQQQHAFSGQSGGNINAERNPTASTSSISGGGRVPSRNNSFTAASNNNLHLSKDVSVTELSHGFSDDGFFNNSDIYGTLQEKRFLLADEKRYLTIR
ncbi:hypothetical protein Bca52824_088234 [Brassica carinata]|uniref:Transcriptional regulator SLK2 n=1 Tax=Brassica carinata TaxID=52824 RepID=A0A8X7PB28_BRACI|nr:hypothetical protein Bca52824_088234 [Brassica carinata]